MIPWQNLKIDQNFDKKKLILFLVILFVLNWLFDNFFLSREYNEKRYTLHTITEINILSRNKYQAKKAVNLAFERIKAVEKMMNYFDPDSMTSRLNSQAYWQDVPVSPDMFEILTAALAGSQISQGAFDITATPITRLYGFGKEYKKAPSREQLAGSLVNVGYKFIKLDPQKQTVRFLKKGLQIDLGGVMKGYAIDQAVAVLRQQGIKDGLVNAGGNIYAFGTNRGKKWRIGIKNPRDTKTLTNDFIELSNNACATSGDYEQYFYSNHQKISHIFNPKTGLPSNLENNIRAVTVIADNATQADILSTACFVLGPEKANVLIPNKTFFY